jgi:hypothetical protein
MSNFLKEVSGVPRGTAMALTDLPSIASDTILGNITGSSATPTALTGANVNTILPVFTSSLNGLAPASGGGTTNFLRADGTWAPVSSPLPTVFGTRASPLSITAGSGLVGGTNVSTTALDCISFIQGSGGPVTITASPAIAAGTIIGQELQIIGRSNTNTVTIPNQSGAVELNGVCTLGASDMLTLIFDGTAWVEKCRNN